MPHRAPIPRPGDRRMGVVFFSIDYHIRMNKSISEPDERVQRGVKQAKAAKCHLPCTSDGADLLLITGRGRFGPCANKAIASPIRNATGIACLPLVVENPGLSCAKWCTRQPWWGGTPCTLQIMSSDWQETENFLRGAAQFGDTIALQSLCHRANSWQTSQHRRYGGDGCARPSLSGR
jgi:hypothetical protein